MGCCFATLRHIALCSMSIHDLRENTRSNIKTATNAEGLKHEEKQAACRFVDFGGKVSERGRIGMPSETPEILPASAHSPWLIILRREPDEKRGLSGQDKMGNVSCLSASQFGLPQSLPLQMCSSGFSGRFCWSLLTADRRGRLAEQTDVSLSLDSDRSRADVNN